MLALVAVWEAVRPLRKATQPLTSRWIANFALNLIDVGAIKLILPIATITFAIIVTREQFGLFPTLEAPDWVAIPLSILMIDLARWGYHYLLHRVPVLWRVHRVHHADHDFDFTVGLRFHPIEGLFTTGFLFPVILLIGPPPVAVLITELLFILSALFVHANGRMPSWIEAPLRLIFVTPDMHRIHHSTVRAEHDSNYSGVFSFWDRLFGTYVAAPSAGQIGMTIGLRELRDPQCLTLGWMLLAPFRSMATPEPEVQAVKRTVPKQTSEH